MEPSRVRPQRNGRPSPLPLSLTERSSRKIERQADIACRFITGNHAPDHSTLARFDRAMSRAGRAVHSSARTVCERPIVEVGRVALDSIKVEAIASRWVNRTEDRISKETAKFLKEEARASAEEDSAFRKGSAATSSPSPRRLQQPARPPPGGAPRGFFVDRQRAHEQRLEERAAKEGQEPPRPQARPPDPSDVKDRKVNITESDSRVMKSPSGYIRGSVPRRWPTRARSCSPLK